MASPGKRTRWLILLTLLALVCYAIVWVGGNWLDVWKDQQKHRMVPASSYHRP
ncbi:MAG TPA: hypothetical protein VGX68_23590 [Thermoanaerobaculia bacterium]|jgi:hypothetical protein|nr:hypothetical protein [Thermoanaerobaculia bacterium]